MPLQQCRIKVFADYHQFYLWDRASNPHAPEQWNQEDVKHRIKVGPHVVVIRTQRNSTVDVAVELRDAQPPMQLAGWDHVAEASLHLPSGQLEVHESTGGPVADFSLDPGWYRVRSLQGGLSTVSEDGLRGEDRYQIVVWPARMAGVVILKNFQRA